MKILLVCGGNIPIPPPSWGGVENLIWQQSRALLAAGHEVKIWNEKGKGIRRLVTALRSHPWRYDVVHLHSDTHTKYWLSLSRVLRFQLLVSTHYGYAAFPSHWVKSYHRTFQWLRRARFLLLISQEIEATFVRLGCEAKMFVLPNGIDSDSFRFAPTSTKQSIVLGRIESRKQQSLLSLKLDTSTVECDFAGPLPPDTDFHVNNRNTRYLGEWSRAHIQENLTEYACLVLLSDGEGHAAVVSEAMVAGLSLVLSPEASHNLDLSRPWITIVDRDNDDLGLAIAQAVLNNHKYRPEIRRYCQENFDWSIIMPQYISILQQVVGGVEPNYQNC